MSERVIEDDVDVDVLTDEERDRVLTQFAELMNEDEDEE